MDDFYSDAFGRRVVCVREVGEGEGEGAARGCVDQSIFIEEVLSWRGREVRDGVSSRETSSRTVTMCPSNSDSLRPVDNRRANWRHVACRL